MLKCNFIPVIKAVITQVFSVTWPFRNHSNMMICCSRKFYYLLSMLKTSCAASWVDGCDFCLFL